MYKLDLKIASSYRSKAQSSEQRGIKFELTFTQYKKLYLAKKCTYTGKELIHNANWSIDRLDNNEGYTYKNSIACDKDLNARKGAMSIEDMTVIMKIWERKKRLLKKSTKKVISKSKTMVVQ